jgi:hypothetical protein
VIGRFASNRKANPNHEQGVRVGRHEHYCPARAGLVPKSWSEKFFTEYVRKNQFSRYMGTSMSSLIQVREDLTRKPGDTVVFATVRRLVGAGVTGNQILEGNEELLNARSLGLPVS